VVYRFADDDVVENPRAFNHLGYREPFVWIDSQFADDAFAYYGAKGMMEFLRYPGLGVKIQTWCQPDIFPLDVITLESPRAGTSGVRMLVTSVNHRQTKAGGRSTISARFVPEKAF
jgi:hypothetical protein